MKRFKDLYSIYSIRKQDIENRLNEFKKNWVKGTDEDVFSELVFCLLTPQSKAKLCWDAVLNLRGKNKLFKGIESQICAELNKVRFKNKKAKYICLARKYFSDNGGISIKSKLAGFKDIFGLRDWLVKNVKGIGYKEASHFLRNIGLGQNLAILDRHILKNLVKFRAIGDIPKTLTKNRYIDIEERMMNFAGKINIPVAHLDLVLWSKETGEIFK